MTMAAYLSNPLAELSSNPTPNPAAMVSGRPTSNSRTGIRSTRRNTLRSALAESEKSTIAKVKRAYYELHFVQQSIAVTETDRKLLHHARFMIFTLLYVPCLATVATIKRETNSWRWPLFSIAYSVSVAWVVTYVVMTVGRFLGYA